MSRDKTTDIYGVSEWKSFVGALSARGETFGDGYAKQKPSLLSAMINVAVQNFSYRHQGMADIAEG